MAMLTSSSTSYGLSASTINSLIQQALNAQREPIKTLTSQKDQLDIKKSVYSDLKTKLGTLSTIVGDLSDDSSSTVFDSRTAKSSDSGVVTATATSDANAGNYTITVSNLAKAHMVRSDQQASSSEELNLIGTFTLNDVEIEVSIDDSLQDIMAAINNAEYAEGKEVTATIVDNHLVIEAASTGIANAITASDTVGSVLASLNILEEGDFKTTLREAEDAQFTVNNIGITRASNIDLDDVIDGVTLNLISETDGEDIAETELTVSPDYTAIKSKISAFVTNLNSTLQYIMAKTKVTGDQEKGTYSRGTLAGETVFSRLRSSLLSAVRERTSIEPLSSEDPAYLADIGVTIGNGLQISLNNSELSSVIESNLDGVTHLFKGVMERFEYILKPFTSKVASTNTLDLYTESINTKMSNIDNRIERMEKLLKSREEMLMTKYSSLYMQNIEFSQRSMLGSYDLSIQA